MLGRWQLVNEKVKYASVAIEGGPAQHALLGLLSFNPIPAFVSGGDCNGVFLERRN